MGDGEILRRGGKREYSPLIHIYNIRNRGVVIPSAEMIYRRCNNKYHKSDNFSPEEQDKITLNGKVFSAFALHRFPKG